MLRQALIGATAGALGTVALNVATYTDMAIRGRSASKVPDQLAGALSDKVGIDLSAEDEGSDGNTAQNRRSGLGALMGYINGLGIGAVYALARPYLMNVPRPVLGVGVALAAMAGSDVPATALGVTDPTSWSASSWALDFGFHLAYGLTTVVSYDALTDS
jgi:hypothetical protein